MTKVRGQGTPVPKCKHQYVLAYQEEINIGYDRAPQYKIRDVFFCQHCLIYRKIDVRLEIPDRSNLGRREVIERFV